jgi:hypothetical protein
MKDNSKMLQALSLVDPANIIPCLEQSIEIEGLNMIVNPSTELEDKIRDLNLLCIFFRCRELDRF